MKLEFDLQKVTLAEFGVGREDGDGQTFVAVPVDARVQSMLGEMVQATWCAMQGDEEGPKKYEPAEKHGSLEYLYLPIGDDMASTLRGLHVAANLPMDAMALESSREIFCYFARLTDNRRRRLTALRRASQFKGIVKNKGRLIRLYDDTLQIVEDTIFKLDSDFDLLIDSANIHILRPTGFEFAGKMQQAILDAVPSNLEVIQKELPFVNFGRIGEYAAKRPRAARYLASIRAQEEMKDIDRAALERHCKNTGVVLSESDGNLEVASGHELPFLEVLDRRRYEVELIKEKPERFRAASRKALK